MSTVGALLLFACSATIPHPVPAGAAFDNGDLRFVAPTGWQVRASTEVSFGHSRRIVYLANQPLHDDCVDRPTGVTCVPPIDGGLRPGGILVIWVVSTCVAQGCDLPPAALISIGNRQGVLVPSTDGCMEIGSTDRAAYYVAVAPQRVDILIMCGRDPSESTRSGFLGFLDAIRWRIP